MVTSRARDIVRAAFGRVPDGFLGILRRLGDSPLPDPAQYWTLYETLSNREHRYRARALMQRSGPISAKHVEIVHRLDPVLVHLNILDRIHSVDHIESANAALALIRRVVSTASDQAIRQSVEHLQPKTDLATFFTRWLSKMDQPPAVPPIPKNDPDFAVLTTGEAMIALGRRYQNCAAQQVPLVATGSHAYVEWLHEPGAIADCRYTTDGRFVLVDIFVHRNGRPSPALCATVRRKLAARGIPALSPGDGCPRVRDVLHLLGLWDTVGDLGFEHEADMEEGLAALEAELSETVRAA
ncbi:hypothetical protein [Microvirga sp. VF16]|uniref:hypothetical protein n=1 Tax=Microvirga sp. VF16 TaxID=2807101 RepID=UPI00193E6005|nr:hypothetical protein [Microvirga sp. VF16]QRM31086.1 hypothetical protein JO965_08880 [Microvirga sp. VF16]